MTVVQLKEPDAQRQAGQRNEQPPVDPAEARIAELERMVGKLTLELEVAKKAFTLLEVRSNGSEQ